MSILITQCNWLLIKGLLFEMELIIKSGKDNRSINAYVQNISKALIDNQTSTFKAYSKKIN